MIIEAETNRMAFRNDGLSGRVSLRAFIIRLPIEMSFAHEGTSPQRRRSSFRVNPDSRRLCRRNVVPGNKTGQIRQTEYPGQRSSTGKCNVNLPHMMVANDLRILKLRNPYGSKRKQLFWQKSHHLVRNFLPGCPFFLPKNNDFHFKSAILAQSWPDALSGLCADALSRSMIFFPHTYALVAYWVIF